MLLSKATYKWEQHCSIKTTKNRSKTKRWNFINTTYTHLKNKDIKNDILKTFSSQVIYKMD